MAVPEWLRLQGPDFYCDLIFKLAPRWTECILLWNYVEEQQYLFQCNKHTLETDYCPLFVFRRKLGSCVMRDQNARCSDTGA